VEEKILTAWIDKPLNTVKKTLQLASEIMEWTPFIRVKGVGVSVFLSEFVQDPENKISIYNVFNTSNYNIDNTLILEENKNCTKNTSNYELRMIDNNTILLNTRNEIKLIRRGLHER
jgi:hypothetical protein